MTGSYKRSLWVCAAVRLNPNMALVLVVSCLSVFALALLPRCSASATSFNLTEIDALLAFKKQLIDVDGVLASWTNSTTAGQKSAPCSWPGVTCDSLYRVTAIQLPGSGLAGSLSPALASLRFLATLDLGTNFISGSILVEYSHLTMLQKLDLSLNQLKGDMFAVSWENMTSLTSLQLGANNLSGRFPQDFCSLVGSIPPAMFTASSSLSVLSLGNNLLSGNIPETISSCFNLYILNLANNKFSGNIPQNLSSLRGFIEPGFHSEGPFHPPSLDLTWKGTLQTFSHPVAKYFDLSSNGFTGGIPSALGDLADVNALDLSANNLSGEIPATLGKLQGLEALDLSDNHLTGSIPHTLNDLNSLEFFNVSDNRLSGPIPGNHLQTFHVSSYAGNLGLCGLPLSAGCSPVSTPPDPPVNTTPVVIQEPLSRQAQLERFLALPAVLIGGAVGFVVTFALFFFTYRGWGYIIGPSVAGRHIQPYGLFRPPQ